MKNVKWKNILQLQAVVIIYTISSVMAKAASGHKEELVIFALFWIGVYIIGNLCIAMAANDQEI